MIYGLSKKLTLLRQQHKMSQSEVARRIGISSSAPLKQTIFRRHWKLL